MESSQQYCLRWNNHTSSLRSDVRDLFQKETFTDVHLILVDDGPSEPLKCHKMVLAAGSKLFQKLLTQERPSEQHVTLILPGVKRWEMKPILEYMYNGEVTVLAEDLDAVMNLGKRLNIKGLVEDESSSGRERTPSPPPLISSTAHPTSSFPDYVEPMNGAGYMSGWNHLANLSRAAESVLNPLLGRSTIFPGQEEDLKILKTALEQREGQGHGHADSSQEPSTSIEEGLNGHSIFSSNCNQKSIRRRGSEKFQQRKKSSTNYKLYTKEQMASAIREVEKGRCALTVAKEFGIPSRTLYDRVRKLGIQTQRQSRSPRSAGAHFPEGIGANQNGNIYRDRSDSDEASMALLDMANGVRRNNPDSEEELLKMEEDVEVHEHKDDIAKEDMVQDDVQDLSVHRTNVILTPSNHTKDEKKDSQD